MLRHIRSRSFLPKRTPLTRHYASATPGASQICFGLSDEQRDIRDLADRFAREVIAPQAAHYDQTMEYPWPILKEAHSLGLMNPHISEAYGGSDLGMVECALVSEALAFGCSGVQTAMEANSLAEAPLIVAANDDIKTRFLGRMTEEPLMASYCVTEPGAGSDVAGIKTKAEKKGDKWVLNGSKMWITNAGHANWFFVLAVTDPSAPPHKSMTGFVVEGDSEGIVLGKKEINMGQRCSDTRMVTFQDVVVPEENILGSPGDGFKIAMKAFDITRPLIAAAATGLAQRALEEATKYAQERKTMGKPIIDHQAVAFMLADMTIGVEAARGLVWNAAWLKSQGERNSFQASIAKSFASKTAVENTNLGLQVFGGIGFNTEMPMEKLYRDAKIYELYEGTTQVQKLIISRQLKNLYPI